MLTFDDWLEMQNNGVLILIDEFKKAPIYNEQDCYATVVNKDTICIYACKELLELGYKTMYQMIKEHKLFDINLVCKFQGSFGGLLDIDALRLAGLRNTWEETFDILVTKNSIAIDMIKKIMSMTEVTNVCLYMSGTLGICIDGDNDEVDNFIYSIPELRYVDIGLVFNFDIFSRDTAFALRDTLDITKEMKQCLL